METHYKLGWLPDVPDTRDIPFAAVFRIPRKLPAHADLRAGCSPVEDQGNLGSCTAQALIGALEFLQLCALPSPSDKSKISRFRDLSRLFVYYNERAASGTVQEDSGAMLRTGIKTLKAQGVCRESLWPYEIRRFTVKPAAACFTEAADHQVTAYQRLNTLAEMKACLAMGLPFVFGFAVYEHVMSAAVARTGRIRLPGKNERMLGGHAVMAVGYQENTRTVLFRNSWGAAWGQAGYGQMPYAYLESRELADDFWCIQGTESNRYAIWKK
ncbi:MAG: C1 family peptidase [Kiritimatiellaeota bacterium]|nr:C1 family peptidase [Kiritimatiellota bacterium]